MEPLSYKWSMNNEAHELRLVPVEGTGGRPYLFGRAARRPMPQPERTIRRAKHVASLDHLVGASEQGLRHGQAERRRCFQVDDQLKA